jgi:hypothetical protein
MDGAHYYSRDGITPGKDIKNRPTGKIYNIPEKCFIDRNVKCKE